MTQSIKHLNFFNKLIPKTLLYFRNKKIDSIQEFALGLLDRLNKSSEALSLIVKRIDKNPNLEFSAGIIIRAMILDMILSLNLYKILKDNLDKRLSGKELKALVEEFCNKVLADGLDNTAKSLKAAKEFGYINERQLKQVYNNFAFNHQRFLKQHTGNGEMIESKYGKGDSPTYLFKKLAEDSKMRKIAGVFDQYLYYSKYDHFGVLYFETLKSTEEENKTRINKVIDLFVNHCLNLYDILDRASVQDVFIAKQTKKAEKYFMTKSFHKK